MKYSGPKGLRNAINATVYCSRLLALLNAVACAGAVALFVSKVLFGREPVTDVYTWFAVAAGVLCATGALMAARPCLYSLHDAEILYDYYGGFKGAHWLAVHLGERRWLKPEAARPPAAAVRLLPLFRKLVPALVLIPAALFVPVNEKMNPGIIQSRFEEDELAAREKMAVELKEAGALSAEDLNKIKEEIENIRSRKTKRFSHERWEALDGIGERMLLKAEGNLSLQSWARSAAEELNREIAKGDQRNLSKLAKQAEEMNKALQALSDNGMLDTMPADLAEALGKAGADAMSGKFQFDPSAKDAGKALKDLDKFLDNAAMSDMLARYELKMGGGADYDLREGKGEGD